MREASDPKRESVKNGFPMHSSLRSLLSPSLPFSLFYILPRSSSIFSLFPPAQAASSTFNAPPCISLFHLLIFCLSAFCLCVCNLYSLLDYFAFLLLLLLVSFCFFCLVEAAGTLSESIFFRRANSHLWSLKDSKK